MNIVLAAVYLFVTFTITLLAYKYFGKEGLYIWICISIILSNIQSVKLIEFLGVTTVLGNVAYSNIYLATDILTEQYGRKTANKSVLYGFITMFLFTILMLFSLYYKPSVFDTSQESFVAIFSIIPRISIASLCAYLTSQYLDIFLFLKIKKRFNKLWLSNNGGTIISQLLDTVVFVIIGYFATVPFSELLSIGLTMYILKVIIAICDTGFIYIAKKIKVREENDGHII
jgi:uncharacterized integral membrane protein (TIGR00697 family)